MSLFTSIFRPRNALHSHARAPVQTPRVINSQNVSVCRALTCVTMQSYARSRSNRTRNRRMNTRFVEDFGMLSIVKPFGHKTNGAFGVSADESGNPSHASETACVSQVCPGACKKRVTQRRPERGAKIYFGPDSAGSSRGAQTPSLARSFFGPAAAHPQSDDETGRPQRTVWSVRGCGARPTDDDRDGSKPNTSHPAACL